MECVNNNREILTKGENFECKQVEPSKKCIDDRANKLASIGNSDVMEYALLEKELKGAKGAEKKKIESKIKELDDKIDYSLPNKIIQETNLSLVISSFEGNFFDKGYFKVNGQEVDINEENLQAMPNNVYNKLVENAKSLSDITEAEEKN